MNEKDLLVAVALRHASQKRHVTLPLEHLPMPIIKSRTVEIHRPKYLLGVALAGRRNQWLVPAARPSLVQAGVLTETGLIAKKQRRLVLSGFFFSLG